MTARALALALVGLAACAAGPRALVLGEDQCTHCHMTVADARYGAEIVTATGRVLVYDGLECLIEGLATVADDVRGIWVVDFDAPGTLVPAADAFYLRSERLRSPMGGGLAAFGTAAGRDTALAALGGTAAAWAEVRG